MTRIMDCSLLHNIVTDLLKFRGCINIYGQHSCILHFIKTHMDGKIADGKAGSVGFGCRYANYNSVVCAFRGHKFHGKDLCTWHAEKSQPFSRKQFSVTTLSHIHLTI